jgi:hypothetical protein
MPLGRFQRPLDSVQERFGGPPLASDEAVMLGNLVSYVVQLGEDRTDRERVTFAWGLPLVAVPASFNVVTIEALQDLQIERAYAVRTGGGLDASYRFGPVGFAVGATNLDQTIQRSAEAGSGALVFSGSRGFVVAGVHAMAPTQQVLDFPLPKFCVLPAGRALELQCENVNTAVIMGFVWRALG